MGREIRKVPEGWEHPRKDDNKYHPMFDIYYGDALSEWIEANKKWEDGSHHYLQENPDLKKEYPFYAMYCGDAPNVDYYQTRKYTEAELTHIQLYQTTSEGTPISPVFHKDDFEKLCEWASENATTFARCTASKEEWMRMLSDGIVYHQEGNAIFM